MSGPIIFKLLHHLSEKRYDDEDVRETDLKAFFDSKSTNFFVKGIAKLSERWKKVIE